MNKNGQIGRVPVLFHEKEECCGCAACANICPAGAIAMKPDEKGFMYPQIDENKCRRCCLCEKVCPFGGGQNPE